MEDHVPRHAQMGAWVLINDRWYHLLTVNRRLVAALVALSVPCLTATASYADDIDIDAGKRLCSAPGSLDTSLSHAAGLIEIAACHA